MTAFELIKLLVPHFYLDVKEMRGVYEVDGMMLDTLSENIEAVKSNQFVLSADETVVERLERFFGFNVDHNKSLEDRKQQIVSYLVGFGKMSKEKIIETIRQFTGAGSDMTLEQFYIGWQTLFITLERGEKENVSWKKLLKTLSDRLPAHLAFICFVSYSHGSFTADGYTHEKLSLYTHEELSTLTLPLEEVM